MNRRRYYFSIITTISILMLALNGLSAQQYSLRGYAGGLYYLGDLSPASTALSLSQYNPGLGISIGKEWNNTFDFHLKYTYGRISGTDEDARNLDRKERNLSFVSSIYDLGIITEINLNTWLTGLDRYGLRLYYSTGVSVFHFSPQAVYQGRLVKLQPLGTEGQGNESLSDKEKYSLTQISIPFGLGVQFDISEEFELGFEVLPRWTFTDYLDDVSGAYVPLDLLTTANGDLAAALSDRSGELTGMGTTRSEGALRGDPSDADWYLFMGVYVTYKWGNVLSKTAAEEEQLRDVENTDRIKF